MDKYFTTSPGIINVSVKFNMTPTNTVVSTASPAISASRPRNHWDRDFEVAEELTTAQQ